MVDEVEIPESMIEKIAMLEGTLIDAATGGSGDNELYVHIRRELIRDEELKPLLPSFVRSYRDLSAFWGWIKYEEGTYAGRRKLLGEAFTPVMDYLEGRGRAPGDATISVHTHGGALRQPKCLFHCCCGRSQFGSITSVHTVTNATERVAKYKVLIQLADLSQHQPVLHVMSKRMDDEPLVARHVSDAFHKALRRVGGPVLVAV